MTMQTKKKDHPALWPSTGGERIDVFNVQAQELFRTQWAPTCVGVTTVCEIYPLKYRHTGAGRYPLFLVFHICIYKLDCHANWRLLAMTMQLREWRFCVRKNPPFGGFFYEIFSIRRMRRSIASNGLSRNVCAHRKATSISMSSAAKASTLMSS